MRKNKGQSLIMPELNYVCIDIETTGLDSHTAEIIELAAVRVEDGQITDTFSSLVNPLCEIDAQITWFTGISTDMVMNAPVIEDVLPQYLQFIGQDIVVGHNINSFDVNFIYDAAQKLGLSDFSNDFIDTLTMSRKVLPELKKHSLESVSEALNVEYAGAHRALADCKITYQCFERMKEKAEDMCGIWIQKSDVDKDNPLYRKTCVVAGSVKGYTQAAIRDAITELGGICKKTLAADTDFLIIGEAKTEKALLALNRAKELGVSVLSADELNGIAENSAKKSDKFGCCHLFTECSDACKCLHRDNDYAKGCEYRKNLEAGRIFYGVNRNVL